MILIKKRTVIAVLLVITLIASIGVSACTLRAPRVYIALGDSVSSGFGVEPESRYADLLFERLKSEKLVDEYYNYAANGYTTSMLLDFLRSTEDLEKFSNASVITLNIGGNNVLTPFMEYLPDMDELAESINEMVTFFTESSETLSEALELTDEAHELMDDFSISDIIDLISFIQRAAPVLEDITDVLQDGSELEIVKLLPVLLGSFPDELNTELQEGVEVFSVEFNEIIEWLKANAPNAVIIVNTVYNPVPQDPYGLFTGLHDRADMLASSINGVIFQGMETGGYVVSDVYGSFSGETNVTDVLNFELDARAMTLNFDIIHPNKAGHEIIAELNYEAYREALSVQA